VQPYAGLIIVLMQSGGEALERFAAGRASAAVRALEEAAPRRAHRIAGATIEDIDVDEIRVGDALLVRPGELVPCDGSVMDGRSHVDNSRLTGEPIPVTAAVGTALMSGAANQEGSLTVRATALASESQYARIVELVRSAQRSKAPLQRLADRYAVWFTPITLAICLIAYLIERDPLRVLAVLVVATPCPLILATPVAIIGGINRAARRRIIVRNGQGLEELAAVTVAVFDKTGTLTVGRPEVARVIALEDMSEREVLRLAAAIEQHSGHLLARSVVDAARERAIPIPPTADIVETPGRGVRGTVEHHRVAAGSRSFVVDGSASLQAAVSDADPTGDGLRAFVAVDERLAGVIEFADKPRPHLDALFEELRALGIDRTLLLSGDQRRYTEAIASAIGIREVRAELRPEDKVDVVRALVERGAKVIMVGDGTNDAPALSAASVGVAIAAHGGGITAEAADVVLLADDVHLVADAIRIGRRALRIARQSIWAGLGLSAVAMVFAAAGFIPPAVGALLQEGIDVAVILNAVRAST
jgi:heavy metal translocating P-type ATPase